MTVSIPTANNSVANGGRRSREKIYKLFPPNSWLFKYICSISAGLNRGLPPQDARSLTYTYCNPNPSRILHKVLHPLVISKEFAEITSCMTDQSQYQSRWQLPLVLQQTEATATDLRVSDKRQRMSAVKVRVRCVNLCWVCILASSDGSRCEAKQREIVRLGLMLYFGAHCCLHRQGRKINFVLQSVFSLPCSFNPSKEI